MVDEGLHQVEVAAFGGQPHERAAILIGHMDVSAPSTDEDVGHQRGVVLNCCHER
jgi:hypothetical protein